MAFLSAQRGHSARRPAPFAAFRRALGVWRQRRHLAQLDPHLRADLGLSEREVRLESDRPIWDVPQSWRL